MIGTRSPGQYLRIIGALAALQLGNAAAYVGHALPTPRPRPNRRQFIAGGSSGTGNTATYFPPAKRNGARERARRLRQMESRKCIDPVASRAYRELQRAAA
jgi:hypothetical protein